MLLKSAIHILYVTTRCLNVNYGSTTSIVIYTKRIITLLINLKVHIVCLKFDVYCRLLYQ